MKNYVVYDASGRILRSGHCPDDALEQQAQEGESVVEGSARDTEHIVVNGKIVPLPEELKQPMALTVELQRARAYPPLEEQLDAIWKGGEAMEAMRAQVMAVKEQFPKETV